MLQSISGKKTYIMAGLTILYAGAGYWTGNLDFNTAVQMILGAGGLSALRAGVTKSGPTQ